MAFPQAGTDTQPWNLCTSHWVYDGTAYPCSHVHAALQPLGVGYPGRVTLSDLVQGIRRRDAYWLNMLWQLMRKCSAACLQELAGCRPLVTALAEELAAAANAQQHVQQRTAGAPPWADPYYGPHTRVQQRQQQQQAQQQQPQYAASSTQQQLQPTPPQPPPAQQQPPQAPPQQELVPCWSYTAWVLGRLLTVQPQQCGFLYQALLSLHHTCTTWQHVAARGMATCLLGQPEHSVRLLEAPAHLAAVLLTAVNAATQSDDISILRCALAPLAAAAAAALAQGGGTYSTSPAAVAAAEQLLEHPHVQQALAACVQGCIGTHESLGPLLVSLVKSAQGRGALRGDVQTKALCAALLSPTTQPTFLMSCCRVVTALLVNEVNPESALTAPHGMLAAAVTGLGRVLELFKEGPLVHSTWNIIQGLAAHEQVCGALVTHHSSALAAALASGLRQRRQWLADKAAAGDAAPAGAAAAAAAAAAAGGRFDDQWLGSCLAAVRQLLGNPSSVEWLLEQEEVVAVLLELLKAAVVAEGQGLPRWLGVLGLMCGSETGRGWVTQLIPGVDWSQLGGLADEEEEGSLAAWYDAELSIWAPLQMDDNYIDDLFLGLEALDSNWTAAATRHLTLPGGEVWVDGTEGLQEVLEPALLAWLTPGSPGSSSAATGQPPATREVCDGRLARLLACPGGRAAVGGCSLLLCEAGARLGAALADRRTLTGLWRLRAYPHWLRPLLGPAADSDQEDSDSEGAQREALPMGPGGGFLMGFLSSPSSRAAGDLMVSLMQAPHPSAWVLSEANVLDAALLGLASQAPLVAAGAPDITELQAGPQLTLLAAVDPVKLVPLVVDRLRSSDQRMVAAALCGLQHLALYRPGAQALVVNTFQEMAVAAGQVMRLQQLEAGAYEAVMGLAMQHAEARVAVTAAGAAARRVGWRAPQQQRQDQQQRQSLQQHPQQLQPPWDFSFWKS